MGHSGFSTAGGSDEYVFDICLIKACKISPDFPVDSFSILKHVKSLKNLSMMRKNSGEQKTFDN